MQSFPSLLLFVAVINSVSSIQWYRGNVISGCLPHQNCTYGAYYSSTINKIILFESNKVILFDPYICTFQPLNITAPYYHTTFGQLTDINDKIYINYKSDKLVVFDPITYAFKLINQVVSAYYSCLISDKVNQNLYIIGGISPKSVDYYWCNLTTSTQLLFRCKGDYWTQIYSITKNTSYFDANLTTERRNPSCINYHNHLYVFGGHIRVQSGVTANLYDIPHKTIEVWDLNITNNKSKLYGWQQYTKNNLEIINYTPYVLIFNDSIYLFQYDAPNPNQIQTFDPVHGVIINDTSSLSFNENNLRKSNRISSPVNVNDELIYIFGGDDANTFQFGVINDNIIEKLDNKCFWSPIANSNITNNPTNNSIISPINWSTDNTYNSNFENAFRIIISVSLITILIVIVGYITYAIKKKRKKSNDEIDIVNNVEISHEMEKLDKRYDVNNNEKKITFSEGNIAAAKHKKSTFSEGNIAASKHIVPSCAEEASIYEQFQMDEFNNQMEGI